MRTVAKESTLFCMLQCFFGKTSIFFFANLILMLQRINVRSALWISNKVVLKGVTFIMSKWSLKALIWSSHPAGWALSHKREPHFNGSQKSAGRASAFDVNAKCCVVFCWFIKIKINIYCTALGWIYFKSGCNCFEYIWHVLLAPLFWGQRGCLFRMPVQGEERGLGKPQAL